MALADAEYVEEQLRHLELCGIPRPSAAPEGGNAANEDDAQATSAPAMATVESPEDIEERLRHLELCSIPHPPAAPAVVDAANYDVDAQDTTTPANATVNFSAEDIEGQPRQLGQRGIPRPPAPRVSISTKQRDESALALWLKPHLAPPVYVKKGPEGHKTQATPLEHPWRDPQPDPHLPSRSPTQHRISDFR